MKKILFAIPLFAMLLVACDPIVDEISPDPNVTPENLTFELVAKNQGNNNIQIVPTPSRYVKVYDATSDIKLAEGTAPSVQVAPPNKELQVYVTTINSDGSITKSASKSIAVTEYTDLPAIYADVFGTTPDGGYAARYKATAGFQKIPENQVLLNEGKVEQNEGYTDASAEYNGWQE